MQDVDVAVLGAGAAGLFCGIEAARRGRRVVVLDHARAPGEKIRISGGGRCNFTNLHVTPERFISQNPRFAASALARYRPADFIARVDRAGIAWHEKTLGQLFCDGSAKQIVAMLVQDLTQAGGDLRLGAQITDLTRAGSGFEVVLSEGTLRATSVVVATGGKSIPRMGATGVGYQIAAEFGLRLVETRPALVPLTFGDTFAPLAGVAAPARVACGKTAFEEAILFTHRGLSGPSILQISSYWREGAEIILDLLPGRDLHAELAQARAASPRANVATWLAGLLPERLARSIVVDMPGLGALGQMTKTQTSALSARLSAWRLKPTGSEGYRTAEVTLGGVDTRDLDARNMEARRVPGLYFIGEVVDVTGWLGGYNFQWAWSSGWAAGQVV
ncbi:MAG: NAD(P)/FAD-dependent oxidoreductase [Roseinatronobacter sp.]